MHDIRFIRENPKAFDAGLARRGLKPLSAELLAIDERSRALTTEVQAVLARRNEASKAVGAAKAQRDDPTDLMAEVAELKERLPQIEAEQKAVAEELTTRLATIPNLPADDVPTGDDEAGNVEQKRWGTPRDFAFEPKEHADLGPALGMDFDTGARVSGARFTFLRGGMARLHRALAQFMLDRHTSQNGYTECNPPVLVNDAAMYGTDKLPKFAEDSFKTTDGRWLIPTSEVSLTASVAGRILDDLAEPIRMTAHTLCFRSEAGAAGRDTRGFIRQHQFEKVELVTVCRPEDSDAEHERMTACAEGILEALELPYRRMFLCTGDMGFGARRTFDLEVWLPGQQAYREISSCSTTGDFQARRMNARYRPAGEKGTRFVHTLNGSGLAVGRTLVAVMENYQQADGSVAVPDVLQPYMGGLTVVTK
ncbi:serine--tRNA ligase [uncultured Sphingomonas sp.]|uniref:serine--tRNA ligase n=1 Tax=uncultured Sphingomonas sp. TaxID=158754 RepID=UPI0025D16586|nr:serine--tRNA ligase [uncultured Sphingomonas sp.]